MRKKGCSEQGTGGSGQNRGLFTVLYRGLFTLLYRGLFTVLYRGLFNTGYCDLKKKRGKFSKVN